MTGRLVAVWGALAALAGASAVLAAPPAEPAQPAAAGGSSSAAAAPASAAPPTTLALPGIVRVRSGRASEQGDELRFSEYVEIETGEAKIQADEVVYRRDLGTVEANGNVVLSFPGALLAGRRLAYNLGPQTGKMEDVVGYFDQDNAVLRAKTVERLDKDHLKVEDGVFTTCTQPTPYWSFRLSSGIFHIGHYAHLKNVAFRAGQLPVFYTPYLVWPIKSGRAAGLLFPEFRNSTNLGTSVGVPYYWPFADNADLTLTTTAYTKVGLGLEAQLDWLPTWLGKASGDVHYIHDQVRGTNRYRVDWRQSQPFWNDFQLTASIQQVSDFNYLTDYETNLAVAATPQTDSTIDLTKTWGWYSLSLRARRYQQYFLGGSTYEGRLTGKTINTTFPQLELRGRAQQIGKTPFYFSFESSIAGFGRDLLELPTGSTGVSDDSELVETAHSRWGRVDFAPQLTAPLMKRAWGDLTFSAGWRGTYYTGRPSETDSTTIVSRSLFRNLWSAGFTFTGPRLQRIYDTPHWSYSPKMKHVIEPFLQYGFRPTPGVKASEIPVFDEVDSLPGQTSDLTYGVRQRFIALRPQSAGRAVGLATAKETSFRGLEEQSKDQAQQQKKADESEAKEKVELAKTLAPVEFASIEVSQSYSFVNALLQKYQIDPTTGKVRRDESGNAIGDDRSFSPVQVRARLNATAEEVFDLTAIYDPANRKLTDTSLSALLRLSADHYVSASWYRRVAPAEGLYDATNYLRARWGAVAPSRRLSLETEWDWNAQDHKLDHQRYEVRWATQCCSFRFGFDQRSFVDNDRREFSLIIDLFGIGEVLNFQRSTQ